MNDYISLVRHNVQYRNLWLARVVSNLGDWFNLLASAALITHLTGAGTALSYLFLARLLPFFVMSPIAGVLADRYERRAIMIATDIIPHAITVLCFLFIRTPEQIWLLYVLTVTQFVLSALYTPAHSALLSNIVEPKDLVTANALDGFTWSTMLAVGALLGGIVAGLFGTTTAFIIDAATFLLAALFVARIGTTSRDSASVNRSGQGGLFQFVAGMSYLRARPFILGVALAKAGGALAWGAVNVMEIPLAQDIFPINGNGSLTLGLLYCATGLGTGLGPLIVRRWISKETRSQLWAILAGLLALAVGILGMSYAPTFALVLAAAFLRALGSGTVWVFSASILQSIVDDDYRGRVFSFEFAVLTLAQSISTLWAGIGLDQLGLSVQEVLFWTSGIALATTLAWAWFMAQAKARGSSINQVGAQPSVAE